MSPQPTRDDIAYIGGKLVGLEPECRAAVAEARKPALGADLMRAVAERYRASGVPVVTAVWLDMERGRITGSGPCVPVEAYQGLDIEFLRARDMGKKLGRRLERTRRALIGAAVTAAAGWGVVALDGFEVRSPKYEEEPSGPTNTEK